MTNSSVSSAASGHASTLTGDGLFTLVHSIKSDYSKNGTFVFNRSTLAAVRKLKDTAGQYVFQANMPDVAANAYPIAFGDFNRGYMIVDRISLAVLRDPFTQATTGNVRYIARRRVGGQVIQSEAIIKQKVEA